MVANPGKGWKATINAVRKGGITLVVQLEDAHTSSNQLADREQLTATQAGKLLGVGHTKIAQLLYAWEQSGGTEGLPFKRYPLDQRIHVIQRRDVDALLERSKGVTVGEARKELCIGWTRLKELIESGQLPVRPHPFYERRRIVDPAKYEALLAERRALSSLHEKAASREEKV